jgi:hypothetical protein
MARVKDVKRRVATFWYEGGEKLQFELLAISTEFDFLIISEGPGLSAYLWWDERRECWSHDGHKIVKVTGIPELVEERDLVGAGKKSSPR